MMLGRGGCPSGPPGCFVGVGKKNSAYPLKMVYMLATGDLSLRVDVWAAMKSGMVGDYSQTRLDDCAAPLRLQVYTATHTLLLQQTVHHHAEFNTFLALPLSLLPSLSVTQNQTARGRGGGVHAQYARMV